ncbi:MAG TPA: hypothetical protein VNT50_00810 [Microbacterium sp.]|uniref:hypothetical protein n=1 Tax=Microbacterium sp. TaxID=51671 RepID=UPI002C895844|nr:hypothetical protein [Microbacterium sp.]HWI30006.1 hypothetical protein [Microbacterium sp.]
MSRSPRPGLVVLVGVAVAAVALTAGGVAHAYWTSGAAGAGAGDTGDLDPLALSPGTPAADLFPGAQTDVVLTATNPNTIAAQIGSLSLDTSQGTGGFAVDGAHAGCSVAALSFTTQTNGGTGWSVPARVGLTDGSLAITLDDALSMSVAAANACQGATFTVYLAAG